MALDMHPDEPDMRQVASAMALRGFRVFPLRPNGKEPIAKGWTETATADPWAAEELWTREDGKPRAYNVGVLADGLVILDADTKDGRDGLAELEALGGLPPTLTVATPSGGKHFYFNAAGVPYSQRKLSDGVDVRAGHGYVVAPGSIVNGRRYEIEVDAEIPSLPQHVAERLKRGHSPEERHAAPVALCDLDTPEIEASAIHYLTSLAPVAEEGARNNTLVMIARWLGDLGVSADKAIELIETHWNGEICDPPIEEGELEKTVRSAYNNRIHPLGCKNFSGVFSAVPDDLVKHVAAGFRAHVKPLTFCIETLSRLPKREWVIEGMMQRRTATLLLAPGGSGKSLLSINMALAIAMGDGRRFGLNVKEAGKVLIINAEDDRDEIHRRLFATMLHYGLDGAALADRVTFYDRQGGTDRPFVAVERDKHGRLYRTPALAELTAELRGGGYAAAILDPLIKCHRADENNNGEADFVMDALSSVARDAAISLVTVHHTKKPPQGEATGFAGNADAGRGASAIRDAARYAKTLFKMTPAEAKALGVPEADRRSYSRLDDAKGNYAPLSSKPQWFKFHNITLPNGDNAPAFAPVEFGHAAEDEARRAKVMRMLAAGRDGKGTPYAVGKSGSQTARHLISKELAVAVELILSDLECLEGTGDIRRANDGDGTTRYEVTDQGRQWLSDGQ